MILMKAAAKRDLLELCRCSKRKAYRKVDMLFAEILLQQISSDDPFPTSFANFPQDLAVGILIAINTIVGGLVEPGKKFTQSTQPVFDFIVTNLAVQKF